MQTQTCKQKVSTLTLRQRSEAFGCCLLVHVLAPRIQEEEFTGSTAQVAFCAGALVDTLLQCGAQHYAEFKVIQARCALALSSSICLIVVRPLHVYLQMTMTIHPGLDSCG